MTTSLLRDTLKNAAEESRLQDRPENVESAGSDSDNELISVVRPLPVPSPPSPL